MRHTFDGAKYDNGALRLDDNFFSKLPKYKMLDIALQIYLQKTYTI